MKIIELNGQIEVLTGLHIGGGDDVMKIGGIDNAVVKTTKGEPYIPGSSLKGKMRSLLEWDCALVGVSGGSVFSSKFLDNSVVDRQKAEILLKLFGDSADTRGEKNLGITRISVGDCFVCKEQLELAKSDKIKLSEAKFENVINRKTGTASNPRQSERVPSGVNFDFSIRVKILPNDNEAEFKTMIERGLDLIEKDYLGGSGSRGYGRVKFRANEWKQLA
ncbi:type III-A CRISPR-associated RAMP protein Csm3 [Campylobacter sp. VBCF_05 NA6]|uniref:type III-A CRISPR-associated RAMP protein Csm3 n=1 Tax=unclassified Campylobacter TaxID=2593542 RepID=UPI0022E9C59C|nr:MULTISPECIES: type III-A CRISPR-associated RAMP protein Csm3 [unclassified Campylobacter]MDA3057104.1 type III-A CRISPR-associated RAMP protein Csm3 [Campylobacter sp. VBCF_04 NA7]MDA3059478.1 type III-A CRISPR-associated RAMP protein Csm3 [Campylobacter sp. VBCF_05 NA6]